MAPRSSETPRDYFEAKAVIADQRAAAAPTRALAECWQLIAENYRWIAYYRRAMGRWRPNLEDGDWGQFSGGATGMDRDVDRAAELIARNRLLLALAEETRALARDAIERAEDAARSTMEIRLAWAQV